MVKNSVKQLLTHAGIEIRLKKIKDNRKLYKSLFSQDSIKNRRFYNICAGGHIGFGGGFQHPLWTNIDLDRPWSNGHEYNPEIDIAHDLLSLKALPLETESGELIHSRFSVEHINDEAAQLMFDEVFRVLKKGGIFRVIAPNIDLDYRAYIRGDLSHFTWRDMFSKKAFYEDLRYNMPLNQASIHQVFLVHFASNASTLHNDGALKPIDDKQLQYLFRSMPYEEALNYCTSQCSIEKQRRYRQNHINWWNQKKFEKMLTQAGFKTVYSTAPHQSASPVMRQKVLFDELWTGVALYMEAIKD